MTSRSDLDTARSLVALEGLLQTCSGRLQQLQAEAEQQGRDLLLQAQEERSRLAELQGGLERVCSEAERARATLLEAGQQAAQLHELQQSAEVSIEEARWQRQQLQALFQEVSRMTGELGTAESLAALRGEYASLRQGIGALETQAGETIRTLQDEQRRSLQRLRVQEEQLSEAAEGARDEARRVRQELREDQQQIEGWLQIERGRLEQEALSRQQELRNAVRVSLDGVTEVKQLLSESRAGVLRASQDARSSVEEVASLLQETREAHSELRQQLRSVGGDSGLPAQLRGLQEEVRALTGETGVVLQVRSLQEGISRLEDALATLGKEVADVRTEVAKEHAARLRGTRRAVGALAVLILLTLGILATGRNRLGSLTPWSGSRTTQRTSATRLIRTLSGHHGAVWSATFSPDGEQLAVAAGENGTAGHVGIWRLGGEWQEADVGHHRFSVRAVTYSPRGDYLASGGGGAALWIWPLRSGEQPRELRGHPGMITAVQWSPDGDQLASGGFDGIIRLWEPAEGRLRGQLDTRAGRLLALAYAPDGATLASGGDDGQLRIWDVDSGRLRSTFALGCGRILAVAFSPDGATIAAGGDQSGAVQLMSLSSGASWLINTSTAGVTSVAFSPGNQLLCIGSLGQIQHYAMPRRSLVGVTPGLASWVTSLAFSPDGKRLAASSGPDTHVYQVQD